MTTTTADTTTRSTFNMGPGRVDFKAPDEGFGLEWTPKPKIQRDPSPQQGNLVCGMPLYIYIYIVVAVPLEHTTQKKFPSDNVSGKHLPLHVVVRAA